MNARNPFSSISNLSFLRNAQHLSCEGRTTKTHSSHKNYLDYQGSYLRDSYLRDWEIRKNQQKISSKVMGIEALRYMPQAYRQQEQKHRNSKVEYYNLQNYQTSKDIQTQKPLKKPNSNFLSVQNQNPLMQSSRIRNNPSQKAMKSSTKDMFGSEYFKNRFATVQSQDESIQEEKVVKKAHFNFNLQKKQPGSSRFKIIKESKQLSQLEQHSQQYWTKSSCNRKQKDPETLFLKSRGKTFYLYHRQESQ